jgi:hypothetical protein
VSSRELVFPAERGVFATGQPAIAPSPFYVTGEDRLRIVCVNTLADVRLKIQARMATRDGHTVANSWDHAPTSDRVATSTDMELGAGALLNVTVFVSAGSPLSGQTYVIAQLVRGIGAAAIVLGTILGGYVTSTQALGFPGSPIASSIEGGGYIRTIAGTQPAAGTDFQESVPTGARWELLRLFNYLVASAVAGTRVPYFELISSAAVSAAIGPAANTTAAQTINYTWAPNLPVVADVANGFSVQPTPGHPILLAGDSFRSATFGMLAGDQWNVPRYVVREWLEVP